MRSRCCHRIVCGLERTQQTSLLRLRVPPRRYAKEACTGNGRKGRGYATASQSNLGEDGSIKTRRRSLSLPSEARFNEIGVQHVSSHIHQQLFPIRQDGRSALPADQELVDLSKRHLADHDLLGKQSDQTEPIAFDMPALQGSTLDEHFTRLGKASSEPYLSLARKYARASPPPKPRKWVRRSGWTKYHPDGSSEQVDAPDAECLTFDVEVVWHETSFPAMATAVSGECWYAWLSPWLLGESESDRHLIPLGDRSKEKIIIGHNIGYDRARTLEEYSLEQSKNFFIDTMSLHVAVNGMCSRQRPSWTKARKAREFQDKVAKSEDYDGLQPLISEGSGGVEEEEDLWVGRSSANSLRDVARFHCDIKLDKSQREYFGELDRAGVMEKLDELMDYCAADVEVTHKVYKKVLPAFLETCPHPVSFAALRHLSTEILPVDQGWERYIEDAEATYQRLSKAVEERLVGLTERALEHKAQPEVYEKDPWLSQLDWSGQEIRYLKPKKKGDEPRMAARQKKPGQPNWYKELFSSNDSDIVLTVRTRIAPLLLRLAWDGNPLFWSDKYGWAFKVRDLFASKYRASMLECDTSEDDGLKAASSGGEWVFFKLPHANGPNARVASPMAKGYLQFFENGTLGSEYEYAREALEMNASCSYWISARDRIRSQMVVYQQDLQPAALSEHDQGLGFILPQVVPMGTITRRAVENTWLTASNAKKNRVGSELKSIITAPPGYCFVGADVDSQELWIASLVGDANFKLHGGGALGFMTLEGTKAAGTDLHSRTAKILGISRNDAKVFNYGRIYGAGLSFAQTLLRRFNPSLSEAEAEKVAKRLYEETKGKKMRNKTLKDEGQFWFGGTESLVFNRLEHFAMQEKPRTPVLGAGITEALMKRFLSSSSSGGRGQGGNNYLTSRINWAIQSSGVDYLHLLIVSMEYLTKRYGIQARLALTVHDEIRYSAKEEDKYRTAMALQVANVWTRAMFAQQMGIEDLPQSCAYFSAVDIDHVLRKEVDMDCVTPSHPNAIPPGESLDIMQLLQKGTEAHLDDGVTVPESLGLGAFEYQPRQPVMESLRMANPRAYLRAQLAKEKSEVQDIARDVSGMGDRRPSKDSPHPNSDTVSGKASSSATRNSGRRPAAKKNEPKTPKVKRVPKTADVTSTAAPVQTWFRADHPGAPAFPPEEVGFDGYDMLRNEQRYRKPWDVGLMQAGLPERPVARPTAGVRH